MVVCSGAACPFHSPCSCDLLRSAVWPDGRGFWVLFHLPVSQEHCSPYQPVPTTSGVWLLGCSRGTTWVTVSLFVVCNAINTLYWVKYYCICVVQLPGSRYKQKQTGYFCLYADDVRFVGDTYLVIKIVLHCWFHPFLRGVLFALAVTI